MEQKEISAEDFITQIYNLPFSKYWKKMFTNELGITENAILYKAENSSNIAIGALQLLENGNLNYKDLIKKEDITVPFYSVDNSTTFFNKLVSPV